MDHNPSSPLETLRQLKEMLDAGALTPAEFEALKQRLVLSPGAALPPQPSAPLVAPVPPAAPPVPPVVLPPAPVVEQHSPLFEDVAATNEPPVAPVPAPAPPVTPSNVWRTAPAPAGPGAGEPAAPEAESAPAPAWTGHEFPAREEEAPARNPLALLLSIGGVLVFLAVVAYLTLSRPPSEHISSTSQTAADSVDTAIDTGPQAAPLPQTTAAPETIRLAPAHPAPVVPARPAPAPASDTVAPATVADSTARQ